jgi:hypothetical protein
VSTPSHPQAPGDPDGSAQPSTAEIPVVQPTPAPVTKQLPPHPGATSYPAHAAQTAETAQPTGPVDFVPGLPGLGTPPPPPPAPTSTGAHAAGPTWPETLEVEEPARERAGTRVARLPQDRGALAGIGLAVLALVLLELGLTLDFGTESLWDAVPLWSAFATLAALVGLVAVVLASAKGGRARARSAWPVGAAALAGLAVFWLLIVLPGADSDRGFLLTAALACLGAALWISAKRD